MLCSWICAVCRQGLPILSTWYIYLLQVYFMFPEMGFCIVSVVKLNYQATHTSFIRQRWYGKTISHHCPSFEKWHNERCVQGRAACRCCKGNFIGNSRCGMEDGGFMIEGGRTINQCEPALFLAILLQGWVNGPGLH